MVKKKIEEDKLAELTDTIVEAMQEKKANDITILDLRNLNTRVVDKFIICHADNDRQVEAIARNVEEEVEKKLKDRVWHREGYENREWILLDYVNIVVHVFLGEKRDFYALEELWGDAEIVRPEETIENK
jgi:ribosome-associated protein